MDWVILGGIATLAGLIYGTVRFKHELFDRREKKLKEMITDDVGYSTVLDEYEKSTPYKRKKFKSSYKGLKINWHFEYNALADTYRMGRIGKVMGSTEKGKPHYVFFKADLNKFPIIKSAKSGDKFYVTGIINKVRGNSVYLKLIDIEKNNFAIY